jgi:hypothetical protein
MTPGRIKDFADIAAQEFMGLSMDHKRAIITSIMRGAWCAPADVTTDELAALMVHVVYRTVDRVLTAHREQMPKGAVMELRKLLPADYANTLIKP